MARVVRCMGEQWPKSALCCLIVWLLCLLVPALFAGMAIQPYWRHDDITHLLYGILADLVVSTFGLGMVLGTVRLWKQLLIAVLLGTTVLTGCYLIAMFIQNADDPALDTETAMGVYLIIVPVAATLTGLLFAGYGVSLLWKRLANLPFGPKL